MTTSDTANRAGEPAGSPDEVRTLSDLLPRFMRLAAAHKTQWATEGRERAALVLLFPLHRVGPVRQSALADLVHADPSTVSRHVASLVDQGLVRRVADETDGRASRLVITDEGHQALQNLCHERETHLTRLTADWDPTDLATFTRLFGRLIDDLETALSGAVPTSSTTPVQRRTR